MEDWMEKVLFILVLGAYFFIGIVITVMLTGEAALLPAIFWPFILIIWILALLVKAAIALGLYLRMLWF